MKMINILFYFLLAMIILSEGVDRQQANHHAAAASATTIAGANAAAAPESQLAIDLPFVQLLKQYNWRGDANDIYGYSVAATDDTIVIGAPQARGNNNANQGSVYVFVRTGADWAQQQWLTAKDSEVGDRFGESVAISGDTIVIGAPRDKTGENSNQGSVYVYVRSGGTWTFQQKITAHDGEANDQFGASVGVSGDTLVAGAFGDNIGTKSDQGSAFVYVRSGGFWSFQQKLIAGDGEANDQFGAAVGISGGTVVVGALLDDTRPNSNEGSAYVFVRSGHVWSLQQKLLAQDAGAGDLFGVSVAISGDTIAVGASCDDVGTNADQGSAYVFARSGTVWTQQPKLTANDGAASEQFGSSVAIKGDTALIGAHFDTVGSNLQQGSAYLFSRVAAGWAPRQRLTAQDGAYRALFGQSVALSGATAVVGAPFANVAANEAQGAIYLFGCGYAEKQRLAGNGAESFDNFGHAVAVDGDTAVIGAPLDDVDKNENQGSAYVFVRTAAGWAQQAQLFAFDGQAHDLFGRSVAISGDLIIVGAPFVSANGRPKKGAAYFFRRSGGTWTLFGRPFGDPNQELYGWSVAVSGETIAVGSPNDDVGNNQNQGTVTIFNLARGGLGTLEQVLVANDAQAFDYFGFSVALSGGRVLIGAIGPNEGDRSNGAAYVFERTSVQNKPWVHSAKLLAADGQYLDRFGNSVALSGNTALISAPGKVIHNPLRRQAAYVFVSDGSPIGGWSQQDRLILGEGYPYGSLSVALNGNTAVVGSGLEYVESNMNQGIVRVFTRSGSVWTPRQRIIASDGATGDAFGMSVAIAGDEILAGATNGGGANQGLVYVFKTSCTAPVATIASVSAASFTAGAGLAPESIVAGFGSNLAPDTTAAASFPLPTSLDGVSVSIRDSAGVERPAPLFFVSPGQINYVIPSGVAAGAAVVTVMNGDEAVASGQFQVINASPALFSADSSGQGPASAIALRVKADGSQRYEQIARYDSAQNRFVAVPIDLGPATDQVYLAFYGTGLRFRSSLSAVDCRVGGTATDALFAGAAPGFTGLDQLNVRLPRSLAGRGEIDVALSVDGRAANKVRVHIR